MNNVLFKIFDEISDGIIATDSDGKVIFLNSHAAELTGWTLEKAKGQPIEKVYTSHHESTGKVMANPVRNVLRTGIANEMSNHTVLRTASGDKNNIEKCGIPIKGDGEEVLGAVLVLRKCTGDKGQEKTNFNTNSITHRLMSELNTLIKSISSEITLFKSAGWPGSERLDALDEMLSKSIYVGKLLSDNFAYKERTDANVNDFEIKHSRPERQGRGGHILVMDDDKMLRDLAERCLIRLGYEATTVSDGEEALHVYRYSLGEQTFDAVIMDLTIKNGMGGVQTIKSLKKINPNIKAIITSGYTNDPVLKYYEAFGFSEVIYKPFGLNDLNRALDNILA